MGQRAASDGGARAALAIVALGLVSAVAYGIVHDQITIRICPTYFTVFHPHVVDTDSLTVLALVWGVLATWWVGLGLGLLLALAARCGSRPKRDARSLRRPVAVLLLVTGASAGIAGLVGRALASDGSIVVAPAWAAKIPTDQHVDFLTNLWAHNGSYLVGGLGGLFLALRVYRTR